MPPAPPKDIRPLLLPPERAAAALAAAAKLRVVEVDDRTTSDLELLGNGGFTPLDGFLRQADYLSVVDRMRLADGQPWSIPIGLAVRKEEADALPLGKPVALAHRGRILATMRVEEKYAYDRDHEARSVWRTTDPAHPGVAALHRQGDTYLGGPVEVLVPDIDTRFGEYRFTPTQTRAIFKERKWERIVAFQTRNPIHRAHEYLQKCALEMVDGLLLHPLVGETKGDDIPADVRMRCYEALLEKYYPGDRTLLAAFPAAMRYAGPREAVFHALVRRNYGCTHFIVGRDHAGVGNYYGTYDAQRIFSEFQPGELGIDTIFFDHTFYCRACGHIASEKTCAHDPALRVAPSGTKVREMLRAGKMLPTEFTRPEVARILIEAYHPEMKAERERLEAGRRGNRRRVVVLGLDCADPALVFDRWKADLPNLGALAARGVHGPLRSCDPPVTVPAWSCMMASRDPGELGIYGFRNRRSRAYDDTFFANASAVKEKRAFEILSDLGKRVITLGVPGTYPVKALNGIQVGCFLAPDTSAPYTHPPEFKAEIERVVGRYALDLDDPRSPDRDAVLARIYDMTDKRFRLAEHLATTQSFDFLMMVEMGPDRIHHGFWRHFDAAHPGYRKGNPHENAVRDYYKYLDHRVGELVKLLDEDTTVLVVSDHGAQACLGGVAINEWLLDNGWLVLSGPRPATPTPLSKLPVDWARTRAWAEGGYDARVWCNVRGREPKGCIEPSELDATVRALAESLRAIPGPDGKPLATKTLLPSETYAGAAGVPPDLLVYFDDLRFRAVATVGHGTIHPAEGEGGVDDAGHARDGIFLMAGPGVAARGRRLDDLSIYDVGPTVLHLLDAPVPAEMRGRVIAS
jgi:sulfate adenylyltransferase